MRIVCTCFFFLLALSLYQCASDVQKIDKQIKGPETGEALAKVYCASCHLFPEPDLLDQYTWSNFILIRMGAFLGIYQEGNNFLAKIPNHWMEPGIGGERIKAANIYPKEPLISVNEWKKIVNYYLENAPEKLDAPNNPEITVGAPFFKSKPFSPTSDIAPLVQSMTVDVDQERIYAAEYQGGIYQYDFHGKKIGASIGKSYIVEMKSSKDGFVTLDMGTRYASDNPQGLLTISNSFNQYKTQKLDLIVPDLMRPVDFSFGDLTGNGIEDIVLAEFGSMLGAISWWEKKVEGNYARHELYPKDGSIKTEIRDVNNDGKNDIIALMGNGDEGIDWYINQGNGKFIRERKLRFPPTNGSTHFQLIDYDDDGVEDILYSNGDNGDYTPLMKPYHGIHLYLNKNGTYKQAFFIPLNGVYQSEAVDFDQDGDMDIAAVSFHPDFVNNQKEGFVIFENDGANNFSRYTIDQFTHSRWMRFITLDIDGDEDIDILLSAMNIKTPEIPNTVAEKWEASNEAIILLENQTTRLVKNKARKLFRN